MTAPLNADPTQQATIAGYQSRPVTKPPNWHGLVTLDLLPRSRWVVDYYPVESVEERADGGLRVRLRTADTAWLRQLVLQLGGGGRVVDPPELATAVADVARGALDAYGVGTTQG